MTRLIAKLFLVLLLVVPPNPATADDISNAERSVVRVVVVLYNDFGSPVGLGHGSGFAIGSNRVLTSAHLFPADNSRRVSLYVVAPNAKAATEARVIYKDQSKDLALLQINGTLPHLTVFGGQIPDGANVFALGYPGNVDLATSNSLRDYLAPKDAVRSQGNFANRRTISGIDALLHTAAIARGNSGGPLLDECGRVIGVNSFTTNSGNGDAPFGFAISNKALQQFLKSAGQAVTVVALRCLSPAERLAAEQAEAAQKREDAEIARRKQERAEFQAREHEAAAVERSAANWVAVAVLCGVLGLLSLGGAGLMFAKDRVRPAAALTTIGLLLAISGAGIFFSRPTFSDVSVTKSDQDLTAEVPSPQPEAAAPQANDTSETDVAATEEATDANVTTSDVNITIVEETVPDHSVSEDDPLWSEDPAGN